MGTAVDAEESTAVDAEESTAVDAEESTAVDAEESTAVDEQADGCTADQRKLDHRAQIGTDSGTAEVAAGIAVRG